MAPTISFNIFRIFLFNYFIKNTQTTNALTFLTHNISVLGSVCPDYPNGQKLQIHLVNLTEDPSVLISVTCNIYTTQLSALEWIHEIEFRLDCTNFLLEFLSTMYVQVKKFIKPQVL